MAETVGAAEDTTEVFVMELTATETTFVIIKSILKVVVKTLPKLGVPYLVISVPRLIVIDFERILTLKPQELGKFMYLFSNQTKPDH